MRLTLIISSLNPGGAERVLSNLASYWSHQEHEVTIVTFTPPESVPFYAPAKGVKITQLNLSEPQSSIIRRISDIFKRCLTLRKAIKSSKPDAVISFITATNLMALMACVRLGVPVIVSERTHPAYHIIPKLHTKLRHLLYPNAARVVVQTPSIAACFKYLDNITVIPNGISIPPLPVTKDKSHSSKSIISVGRLVKSKGFHTLIHAFSLLAKDDLQTTLTIYGDGEERQNLEKLISDLGLNGRVLLPGTVKDIVGKLSEAGLFVFPSEYEGFPNALCEAMASGLPVIASNCSGNIDLIQDEINGRLFSVGNSDKLADIMHELLRDHDQRHRLASEARQSICHLDESKIYRRWDELIHEIARFE